METARFIAALERDLTAVAAVGDDETAAAAERLIQALRGSAGMRLMETLGEAALEISDQLPEGHVEVRLAGPDPELVYVGAEPAEPADVPAEDGLAARITLRLYESLKRELEAAAAREGMSLNAWLVRALSRSVASPPPRSRGNRLTGYGRN
ncbi:MAG TPA: toxin-antitoxin system HicB family antitoxin [Gaiellaceae bacterium]|jgi:HicB-like protein involved in pilus formation|nr:toxin-antitoxin system HicB family antitoxin [Gaiellaceae bacterium]